MYKHCTTEESVMRQRQLEGCLLQLMQTVPYPQITITHICDRVGISRKSFYRYFGSKDGCLCATIDHYIMDGASHYLPEHNERSNTIELYQRFFTFWRDSVQLLDALSKNNLSLLLVERMMINVLEEEKDFHYYLGGSADDSYEQILFMVSGLMGLVINWHHTDFQKSVGQMASIMENIIQK